MAQASISDSKRRKLEKKKRKQKEKRRKRLNAKIDRTVALLVVMIYIAASLLEARQYLGGSVKQK